MVESFSGVDREPNAPKVFPMRPAEEAGVQAAEIKDYIDGKKQPLELSKDDLASITAFEKELNNKIAPIVKINIKSQAIHLDFFATAAGQAMLAKDFAGETIPTDISGLRAFFYAKQDFFNQKANAELKQRYETESLNATNKALSQRLLSDATPDGKLALEGIAAPQVLTVILNPKELNQKWDALRNVLKELQSLKASLDSTENDDDKNQRTAKKEIVAMYRHRVNEIVMQLYGDIYLVKMKEEVMGTAGLNAEEAALVPKVKGFKKMDRSLHLLDKMLRGAGEKDERTGDYQAVSNSTRAAAHEIINILRPLAQSTRDEVMRAKGIDPSKVFDPKNKITAAERKVFGDTVIAHYGELSTEPAGPETLERKGTAPDGKWQFVTGTKGAMAVDPERRFVRDAAQPRSVDEALAVGTAHEIEGHMLQALNRQTIPLAMMSNMNSDRRTVVSESGAVSNEKEMNRAMFGFERYSEGVDSIVGLEARAQGKSYLECVEAVYESKIKSIREKYDLNDPEQRKVFMLVARKTLDGVIERVKRLFRGTETKLMGLDKAGKYITNSQEAAYTEQEIVFEKLKALGLEKLAYYGLNLRTVLTLCRLGLIDMNTIKTPEFKTLELWEKGGVTPTGEVIQPIKDKFKLDQEAA